MARRIQQQKLFAKGYKRSLALLSRDGACDPAHPGSEIVVLEEKPGPYGCLIGLRLRVGYYSRRDGLNVIWIVTPDGDYGQTTDHADFRAFFQIVSDSGETDYYGDSKPRLGPVASA